MPINQNKVGPQTAGDGAPAETRGLRSGATAVGDLHARYQEAVRSGNVYTLALNTTSSTIAAGNIVAAAAAASTQFAVWNPSGSGRLVVLWRFGMGVISGTAPAGPLFHGLILTAPTIATTGTIYNNLGSTAVGVARGMSSAAGAVLTGGTGPVTFSVADFAQTATAAATAQALRAVEWLGGSIILPQGVGWVPLWSGAGTTLLNAYSITWEEVPV